MMVFELLGTAVSQTCNWKVETKNWELALMCEMRKQWPPQIP